MENQNFIKNDVLEKKNKLPSEFILKVTAEFPNWSKIHKALDDKSENVGIYLDDSRHFSMKPEDIILAFQNGKAEEVLEAAKRANRINELYLEWQSNQK